MQIHITVFNATILLRFVPKMLDVSGELLVMSYEVVWLDCVSFSVYSELNKIKKKQKSLSVLNKISELCRS